MTKKKIKVILLKDVSNLGKSETIVDVAFGFAKNFLFPKGLAKPATLKAIQALQTKMKLLAQKEAEMRKQAEAQAQLLQKIPLTVLKKASSEGKLFGSITAKDIVKTLQEQAKIEINEKSIQLEPIKKLGKYRIKVKIYKDIEALMKLTIGEAK